MVSSWILRSLVLVLIQFIGCNNQLSHKKVVIEANTSRLGTTTLKAQPCQDDQIWDMIKERCVDNCKEEACCNKVACPEGTECVEGLGVCAVPIGDGVYDINYGWWTGRSTNRFIQAKTAESPVDIKIINNSSDTVFMKANYRQKALVEISSPESAQKIAIPENYFCPNWCPDKGMPMDLDCGRPRDLVIALASGQSTVSRWTGLEIIDVTRYSSNSGSKACVKKGQTQSGSYEIKVCAYKEYNPTNAKEKAEGKLLSGLVKGSSTCVSSLLQFPDKSTIEVVIE